MPVMQNRSNSFNRQGYYEDTVIPGSMTTGLTSPAQVLYDYLTVSTTNASRPIDTTRINPQSFTKQLIVNSKKSLSYNYWSPSFRTMNIRVQYSYGQTPYITDKPGYPNPYVLTSTDPNPWSLTDGRALEKVLNQARGSHANLSVDLAEGGQTIAMLRKATQLRRTVLEFATNVVKQKKYRKMRPGPTQNQRRLDYVNGKWLEYRYGWMPLVSSLYDLVDAIRKDRVSGPVLLTGRAGRKDESLYVDIRPGSVGKVQTKLFIDQSNRTEYGVYFSLPASQFQFADFTSLNPALVAWELVPFSFIADWFVGVGQCLENWENYFLFRNNFVRGWKTRTTKEWRWVERSEFAAQAPSLVSNTYTYWNEYQKSEVWLVYKQRFVLSSLPTPGGPRVKMDLKPKQFMDIAALVSQSVKQFR